MTPSFEIPTLLRFELEAHTDTIKWLRRHKNSWLRNVLITREVSQAKEKRETIPVLQERGAVIQGKFWTFVRKDPDISFPELIKSFAPENLASWEEGYLKDLHSLLQMSRAQSKSIIARCRREAIEQLSQTVTDPPGSEAVEAEAARILFYTLTGELPQQQVELYQSLSAVGLVVSPALKKNEVRRKKKRLKLERKRKKDDFDVLGEEPNNIGIYRFSTVFHFSEEPEEDEEKAELITTRDLEDVDQGTRDHETGHGVYQIGKNAYQIGQQVRKLMDSVFDKKWNFKIDLSRRIMEVFLGLEKELGAKKTDLTHEVNSYHQDLVNLLREALAKAHDEVLADFFAVGNFSHSNQLFRYSARIKKGRDGNYLVSNPSAYDYFEMVQPKSIRPTYLINAYQEILAKYNDIVETNVSAVQELLNNKALAQPNHLFIYGFLRQNPIETWAERAKDFLQPYLEQLTLLQLEFNEHENTRYYYMIHTLSLYQEVTDYATYDDVSDSWSVNAEIPQELKPTISSLLTACQNLMEDHDQLSQRFFPFQPLELLTPEQLRTEFMLRFETIEETFQKLELSWKETQRKILKEGVS